MIGKTFEIQSALEQALEAFIKSVDDLAARKFLEFKSEDISRIYHQSDLNNLRIVQQTIWDFERFFSILSERHKSNDDALTALLRMLFALSFEVKVNRLSTDDLSNRSSSILGSAMRSRRGAETSPLAAAQQRYPEADLDDTALSDDTLVKLLVKGIVDGEEIRGELDVSSFFVDVAKEPAWRTVWYVYERTEDQFNAALDEMERAFAAREFIVTGEILHVIGLRLWLSIGVLKRTRAQIVEEAKSYINALYSDGRLELTSERDSFSELMFAGYADLGIHENEAVEFREVAEYISEKRRAAELARHPALAEELLTDMAEDPDRFLRRGALSAAREASFITFRSWLRSSLTGLSNCFSIFTQDDNARSYSH